MKTPTPTNRPNNSALANGLPRYFTIRHKNPSAPNDSLSDGCTVMYSLKRYSLTEGDKIARDWAIARGLEDVGSGCSFCGDPIRDIAFAPLRMLSTLHTPNRLLPPLYTIEIDGSFLTVYFETRRVPNNDIKSVFQFLRNWASNRNLSFCSSCHSDNEGDLTNNCRSYISFSPIGTGGRIDLLVTPGSPMTQTKETIAPPEDEPLPQPENYELFTTPPTTSTPTNTPSPEPPTTVTPLQ